MNIDNKILSQITVFNKYAKYIPELERRESWNEIVTRYQTMMIKTYPNLTYDINKYSSLIRDKKILPSMRALQFAGGAIYKNHARIYNCCYLPIDDYRSFSEALFLLLGGTGILNKIIKYKKQFYISNARLKLDEFREIPEVDNPELSLQLNTA